MAGLEQVHGRDAPRDQLGLDLRLGVPRQEEAPALERAEEHDRDVVHRAAVAGRLGRDTGGVRREHVEVDPIEREAVARCDAAARGPAFREDRREGLVPRAEARHPGLHDPPDAVTLQDQRQSRDMVLVRVGQHDEVDPAVPRRHPSVERDEEPVGIRAAVDEHAPAGRAGHEDRIPLSDVEDDDMDAAVGPRGAGDNEDGDRERPEQPGQPQDPRRPWVAGRKAATGLAVGTLPAGWGAGRGRAGLPSAGRGAGLPPVARAVARSQPRGVPPPGYRRR
jgi:hypothetical protein